MNVNNNRAPFVPTAAPAAAPKPARPTGPSPLFANDSFFAAESEIPTVGDPVGTGGGGGGVEVDPRTGTAPGGGVVGGHGGPDYDDGRSSMGGFFNRVFSGSGSGSSG